MKTVIQRVKSATVTVDGQLIASILRGLLVFAAVSEDDGIASAQRMASKVLKVKLWEDPATGTKWKKTVADIDGQVLCVSQFTPLASAKDSSPCFHRTPGSSESRRLYNTFFTQVKTLYSNEKVNDGIASATTDGGIVYDGPVGVDFECIDEDVTIIIDTDPPHMDDPTSFDGPLDSDTISGHIHKQFVLPASLLE